MNRIVKFFIYILFGGVFLLAAYNPNHPSAPIAAWVSVFVLAVTTLDSAC